MSALAPKPMLSVALSSPQAARPPKPCSIPHVSIFISQSIYITELQLILCFSCTAYSVASIQAGGTLKATIADGNAVPLHIAGGPTAAGPGAGGGSQTVSSSCQTGTLRQRTISGTQTQNTSSGSLTTTAQQTQPPTLQTPPNGPVGGAIELQREQELVLAIVLRRRVSRRVAPTALRHVSK